MISYDTLQGKIIVSETYLSKLIGNEVTSCFGVVGMMPSSHRQRISKFVSRAEKIDTGIKVTGDAEKVMVEIHIVVTYGMNINAIAASITEKVKYVVKEVTGIDVTRVVVKVDGIIE